MTGEEWVLWGRVYNLGWSLGMFLLPIVALVLLWDDRDSSSFVLTAIGLGVVFVGVIIVSNTVKTPHYKVMLGPRSNAAELGGGTRQVLRDQLDPDGDDLVRLRSLHRGADRPLVRYQ